MLLFEHDLPIVQADLQPTEDGVEQKQRKEQEVGQNE